MEDKNRNNGAPWWQPSLILFYRLSGWIAGPVIIAVFLGKYLDRRYGTEPWLFLLTVGIAFFVSTIGIVKDAMREMKRIDERNKENEKGKDGE